MYPEKVENNLEVELKSPFFENKPPEAAAGYLMGLWDYEVVEIFFLNSKTEEYLELEFGPHGHFLALKFKGERKQIEDNEKFEFEYKAQIDKNEKTWTAKAIIPLNLLPNNVNKYNCYA